MSDIVERLRFDAARCEATFSKGVASNIEEAADEIERLRAALEEEWRENHWEKCGHNDCVSFGGPKPCHHERPAPIAAYEQRAEQPKNDPELHELHDVWRD